MPSAYGPVLLQVLFAAGLACTIIGLSHLFGQRARRNKIKDEAYECGMPSEGNFHARFSVKFYVTAMLFILFDIEVIFLIPWAFVYREFLSQGLPILMPILFFVGLLLVGFLYEWKKGALEWEK